MNTWNYRVMRFLDLDGVPYYEIREIYYKNGQPNGYSEQAAGVGSSEGVQGLKSSLDKMREALDKPILTAMDCGQDNE